MDFCNARGGGKSSPENPISGKKSLQDNGTSADGKKVTKKKKKHILRYHFLTGKTTAAGNGWKGQGKPKGAWMGKSRTKECVPLKLRVEWLHAMPRGWGGESWGLHEFCGVLFQRVQSCDAKQFISAIDQDLYTKRQVDVG